MSLQERDFEDADAGLLHYGVKGMKWGVRRSPDELGKSREKLSARAEKHYQKTSARDEKWVQKKLDKGNGEKALERLDRQKMNPKKMESYKRGVELRTKQFDKMVERQVRKDPNFKSTMTEKEKRYLERKAANVVFKKNYAEYWIKGHAVDKAVATSLAQYKKDKVLDPQKEVYLDLGAAITSYMLASAIWKTNTKNMRRIIGASRTDTKKRRSEMLRKELEKTKPLG